MTRKIRICIDLRVSQKSSKFTGVGIYAKCLAQALLTIESEFEFIFLVLKGYPLPFSISSDKLITVFRPRKPESFQEIYDMFFLRYTLKKNNISLFHSTVPGLINSSKDLPVVITVHDIIPDLIRLENTGSIIARGLYKLKMHLVSKASYIVTDSEATRVDLCDFYKISKNRVSSVYLGSQFNNLDYTTVRNSSKSCHDRPYLLYLGGFNFRKNVKAILQAFSMLIKDFSEVDLLVAGKPSQSQALELEKLCLTLNLGNRVVWLGFVPDNELPNLYVWSKGFVYPSLYEGFGIPVLEAMQFGSPVITSDRGSIPEIVGNAGLVIDPRSEVNIYEAMKKLLLDKDLQVHLRKMGFEQAGKFAWRKCAIETVASYKQALKEHYENRD